jgi:hypothetical protein
VGEIHDHVGFTVGKGLEGWGLVTFSGVERGLGGRCRFLGTEGTDGREENEGYRKDFFHGRFRSATNIGFRRDRFRNSQFTVFVLKSLPQILAAPPGASKTPLNPLRWISL